MRRRDAAVTAATLHLHRPQLLADVRGLPSGMGREGKIALVGQAIALLEDFYAHLPLKRASLAIDPVQAARLLLDDVDALPDGDFVAALIDIFQRVGDLHTIVTLPAPWSTLQAFLPYLIQEYADERGAARHLVTNVSPLLDLGPDFVPGVEVTHWNGVPMARMIAGLARQTSGANPAARRRAANQMLTTRSLGFQLAPAEDWVTLSYVSARGPRRLTVPWQVMQRSAPPPDADAAAAGAGAGAARGQLLGVDSRGFDVQRIRKQLFAPDRFAHELEVAAAVAAGPPGDPLAADDSIATSHPKVLSCRTIEGRGGPLGYLRIWNFDVYDPVAFVEEVARLVRLLPARGLVVDVRGNPGGWIPAAEGLLQLFTDRHITPEPVQFRNTPLIRATATLSPEFAAWRPSLDLANLTGELFSQGIALTDEGFANGFGRAYSGPVAVLADALCYSACDFAGGANVWQHAYLRDVWRARPDSPFVDLPPGAGLRLAIRRSLRVGARAGIPVEDLGVRADHVRPLTRRDLLDANADHLAFTESLLTGP